MEAHKRHAMLWKSVRPLVYLASKAVFNYDADKCKEKGPLLIMSNHNSDLDPLLVAYSFPNVLYFVASEDIMRSKARKFLNYVTDIIPRQKGGSASKTVRGVLRHVSKGHDVCIFPEGNRSWDGNTRAISPATGKMARLSDAKLVTYRTEGVYFSSPRWSGGSLRRGKARGRIVGIYEPEYLRTLSAEEVQKLIERDLSENAYDRQRKKAVKFHGRKLAEHLETLLFACPNCHTEGKMRSEGDYFYCDACGTKLRYTSEGFFVGKDLIYDTVLDWNIWQNSYVEKKCLEAKSDEEIFSDTQMQLYSVNTGTSKEFICSGALALYRDRLVLPDKTEIPVNSLKGMAVRGKQDIYFSTDRKNYLIKSSQVRCVSKYLTACTVFDKRLQYGI